MYKPNCKQKMHQVISPRLACIEMNSTSYDILKLNPLSPKSDQHETSPCNNNAL